MSKVVELLHNEILGAMYQLLHMFNGDNNPINGICNVQHADMPKAREATCGVALRNKYTMDRMPIVHTSYNVEGLIAQKRFCCKSGRRE